jgi:hypothetical protein
LLHAFFEARLRYPSLLVFACGALGCGKVGYDALEAPELVESGAPGGGPEGGEASPPEASDNAREADPVSDEGARDAAIEPVVGPADASTVESGSICPTLASGGPMPTPMYGATNNGTSYGDICPPGEVIIGFAGSTTGSQPTVVGQLQTLCGKVSIAGTPCQITVSAGTTLPMRGTNPRTPPWTERCPLNQVVVGIYGRAGFDLDALGIYCAPLTVSRMGSGVSHGMITVLPPQGGSNGPPFQDGCRPEQLAVGSNLQTGQIIYAFGIFCATASLVP